MNPLQYLVAESTYEKNANFIDDEYFGGTPGGPVSCGGGDNDGSGGTPG